MVTLWLSSNCCKSCLVRVDGVYASSTLVLHHPLQEHCKAPGASSDEYGTQPFEYIYLPICKYRKFSQALMLAFFIAVFFVRIKSFLLIIAHDTETYFI